MEKIKVLQINSVYKIASTGRTCFELCTELEKTGSFIIKTACKNSEIDVDHTFQIGNKLDYKVHALISRITGLPGYYSTRSTLQLIKNIEEFKPDIVHLRNLHSNHINVPLLLEYLGKKEIATVITLHDCFTFTGKCVYPILAGCKNYLNGCGECPQLKHGNKSWFFDRTHSMLEDKKRLFSNIPRLAVVGVSNWVTSESVGSILDFAVIRKTVYNWIDLDTFYPRNEQILKFDIPVILGVASHWEESKGYKEFCLLSEALKDIAKIVLVGDIKDSDKIPSIYYYGVEKDTNKLAQLYSCATVFFNPTKMETFGKVSAEALACGTPVVAYNVTANPEIIGPGCGYVVDENQIQQAIEKIKVILSSGKSSYTSHCVQYAREHFELCKNAREYATIYKNLVEMKGR